MVNLNNTVDTTQGPSTVVWMVASKTSLALFDTDELARQYVASFPPSVSGGMTITPTPVFGTAKPQGAPTDAGRVTWLEEMHGVPGKQSSRLGYSIVNVSRNGWTLDPEFGGTEHAHLAEAIDAAKAAEEAAYGRKA